MIKRTTQIRPSWLEVAKIYVRSLGLKGTAIKAFAERDGTMKIEIGTCDHLNSKARGNETPPNVTCLDCGELVPMTEVFNNWIEKLQNSIYKRVDS
jgi:hypothetical protein